MKSLYLHAVTVMLILIAIMGVLQYTALAENIDGISYQRTSTVYDKTIYRADDRVTIYDLVNGDIYCFGDRIIIDATVNGDIMCAGSTVSIKGTVAHDVRVIGDTVQISANIEGNVSVIANKLTLTKESVIANDATIIARTATLNGQIGRDVTLRADTIDISGTVGRNVTSYHSNMTITPSARLGSLNYASPNSTQVPDGAVIGSVTKIATSAPTYLSSVATGTVFLAALLYIAWFVSLILTALGVAFLFPKSLDDSVIYAKKQPWVSALAGLMTLCITPIVIGLLTVSIVGIPLAIIIGLLFGAVVMLGTPFVAHLLGTLIFPERSHPTRALVGAVLLLLILVIPIINIIALIVATIFGAGLVMRVATERYSTAAVAYRASTKTKRS